MSTPRFTKLADVWAMMEDCAKGYKKRIGRKQERWIVTYNEQVYYHLPTGPHGRRANTEIRSHHVRHMVDFFKINECAAGHLSL